MVMTRESTTWLAPPGEDHGHEARERSPSAAQAVFTGRVPAEALVVHAIPAGTENPRRAARRLFVAADGSRDRLSRARSVLSERLHIRSADVEATLALRIVERALAQTLSRRALAVAARAQSPSDPRREPPPGKGHPTRRAGPPSSATGEPAKLLLGAEEVLCTLEAPAASCTHTSAVATPGV